MRQPAVHEHSQQLGHAPLDFDPRASAKKIGFVKSKKNLWGESRKPVSLKCPKSIFTRKMLGRGVLAVLALGLAGAMADNSVPAV